MPEKTVLLSKKYRQDKNIRNSHVIYTYARSTTQVDIYTYIHKCIQRSIHSHTYTLAHTYTERPNMKFH